MRFCAFVCVYVSTAHVRCWVHVHFYVQETNFSRSVLMSVLLQYDVVRSGQLVGSHSRTDNRLYKARRLIPLPDAAANNNNNSGSSSNAPCSAFRQPEPCSAPPPVIVTRSACGVAEARGLRAASERTRQEKNYDLKMENVATQRQRRYGCIKRAENERIVGRV